MPVATVPEQGQLVEACQGRYVGADVRALQAPFRYMIRAIC